MSNILTRAKQAAAALTAVVAINVATAAPAYAWGHAASDKARNAALVIGGLAVGVAAIRRVRRPTQVQSKKHTLG